MVKYILSYGGGVNSSALFFHLLKSNKPIDLVIFADTGEELKHTYAAVEEMKRLCLKHNIEFVTVQSTYGNLYDYYFKNKSVMSLMRRDCTSKFKVSPIRQYIRKTYGKKEKFVMYIGIAYDEYSRVRTSPLKYMTYSYPFCDDKITRKGNQDILDEHKFITFKSGCKGCLYNKKMYWIMMSMNDKPEFERHLKLEEQNTGYPRLLLNGYYSLRSLINYKDQTKLEEYMDIEPTCDISGSCFL